MITLGSFTTRAALLSRFSCLAVCVSCACASATSADITHTYIRAITGVEGTEHLNLAAPGPLGQMNSMTVDEGDLWVAEGQDGLGSTFAANSRVDEFNGEGTGVEAQLNESEADKVEGLKHGVAVGHGTGKSLVYVGGEPESGALVGTVNVFESSGAVVAQWTGSATADKSFGERIAGLAVDGSARESDWAKGDVYVATEQNVIDVFLPEAGGQEKLIAEIKGTASTVGEQFQGSEPAVAFSSLSAGLVVDSANGDLFILDKRSTPTIDVFEPEGSVGEFRFVRQITESSAGPFQSIGAIAVNSATGEFYVTNKADKAVDEFSESGGFLGSVSGTPSGSFVALQGLAVDPVSGDVYVGNRLEESGEIDIFGPDVVVPDVVPGEAVGVSSSGGVLAGTVNPDGAGSASCVFEWGSTEALGHTIPCSAMVPNGTEPVEVSSVALSGLEAGTTYYYKLRATNEHGSNISAATGSFLTLGPGDEGASVTQVTDNSATLNATLDPHGAQTFYYFQYGTSTSYTFAAPVLTGAVPAGVLLGANSESVAASQGVSRLAAGVEYHYRVVAVGDVNGEYKEFPGPDHVFRTQPGSATGVLPDGRAWELVSPANKLGALLLPISEAGVAQASEDGGAMSFLANSPTEPDPEGYADRDTQVFAERGLGGWASLDISTPEAQAPGVTAGIGYEYRFFSNNLSQAIVEPQGPFTQLAGKEVLPIARERTVYRRADFTCGVVPATCYTPLVTPGDTPPGTKIEGNPVTKAQGDVQFVGSSSDGNHVIVESSVGLTETPGDMGGLYEWTAGHLQLVSVRPEGEGGPTAIAELGFDDLDARNAVSSGGNLVVWGSKTAHEGQPLYDWDAETGKSIRLDVPQLGAAAGGLPAAEFQGASADGSRVFFTDSDALTAGVSGRELYVCDVTVVGGGPSCTLTALAPSVAGMIAGVSEDGSYVYFVEGTGLFVDHEVAGVWSGPQLVAVLSAADSPDWSGQGLPSLAKLTARVSPNGQFVAFMSQNSLTGYDNDDAVTGAPDEEVYIYDAMSKSVVCASCNPTGARPIGTTTGVAAGEKLFEGFSVWPSGTAIAGSVPGWTPYELLTSRYQSRYLLNSGRLFFDSSDGLVPGDVNGAMDVYEWEPVEVGGCRKDGPSFVENEGGCVGLVSSGLSSEESVFLDASETGGDVFFLTGQRLASTDQDNSLDVYDAHECTATSPCVPSPLAAVPPCQSGDACKAGPTPQPTVFGPPATATFSGAGNASPPKAGALSRAQQLKAALEACAKKPRSKRKACVALAEKRYGKPKPKKKKAVARKATVSNRAAAAVRGANGRGVR